MGMKKVCDVFGTTKDVASYEINVMRNREGAPGIHKFSADLCPRALERLITIIEAGLSEPPRKKGK